MPREISESSVEVCSAPVFKFVSRQSVAPLVPSRYYAVSPNPQSSPNSAVSPRCPVRDAWGLKWDRRAT